LFLHDWDDEDCVTILKRCKEAVLRNGDKGGKVIVMDMVLDNQKIYEELSGIQLCNDVLMMAVSGKERTLTEWEKLFLAAGFTSYNITPILGSARSLIEVYP
ncbi:O-methyltransferase COMT-type, partial [Parasponia andersonii]